MMVIWCLCVLVWNCLFLEILLEDSVVGDSVSCTCAQKYCGVNDGR